MPSRPKKPSAARKHILSQFLAELEKEIDAAENLTTGRMTKGQALVKGMIDEALKGDTRMQAYVIKLAEQMDFTQEEQNARDQRTAKADWELLFAFYGKYEKLIKQEIKRLKKTNPSFWNFEEWFHPTLKSSPWYKDLHE